jgi:hypothetical protein
MIMDTHRLAALSLRRLGLDPGRALANARPSPTQVASWRLEQWAYIQRSLPNQPGRPRPPARLVVRR